MDVCRSPEPERIRPGKNYPRAATSGRNPDPMHRDVANIPTGKTSKESKIVDWVSPTISKPRKAKGDIFPFSNRLESSFEIDCGSSVISLDFGLVSPNKNWCSPPQRIERAQNREWSSPHRVIDRPNPENSPGNWISMKESCLPLRHSPTLAVSCELLETPAAAVPVREPEPRPLSQSTYVIPETVRSQESIPKPTRKTSILEDYEPERVVSTRKRSGPPPDSTESTFLSTDDKVRRLVDSSGHVIKISLLNDFEAPAFGKCHGEKDPEKPPETVHKEAKYSEKTTRGPTNKVTKLMSKLPSSAFKPQAKKKRDEENESVTSTRIQFDAARENYSAQDTEIERDEEKDELKKSTRKMIQDLEEILNSPDNENEKKTSSSMKQKVKEDKSKPKTFRPLSNAVEDKPIETPEKRKRNAHPKAVQEYIKNQKQKRMEQVKTEKKTKDAEKEARKKKLEELRIKSLKLAAQSKKKKLLQPPNKIVEPEDDVTMSLGLKQKKPKVSYNESISKLKKKASQKPQPEEKSDEEEDKTLENIDMIHPEKKPEDDGTKESENVDAKQLEGCNLKKPVAVETELKPVDDINATLKKLADTLHLKLEKEKQVRPVSLASKSAKDPLSQVPSQETLRSVKSAPEENRQLVTVDLETIQTLKNDIKKISENFKVLHRIIVDKTEHSRKEEPTEAPKPAEQPCDEKPIKTEMPYWFKTVMPMVYPYNVFTAFQQKMNLKTTKTPSTVSQEISNKYDSEFEALSMPSDRLPSVKQIIKSFKSTSCTTSEENYYSLKNDSGSELSSSILDSEKQNVDHHLSSSRKSKSKDSLTSSIITEITSRSIQLTTSKGFDSNSDRENLVLVTPDLKLISNDLHQEKLNNYNKNLNVLQSTEPEELNNSEKSYKEQKTDSAITELIDNLTENEKSVKSTNEKTQNIIHQEEIRVRRSYFQPEMLHLQFQAELTLLETFQQSLSHFLEAERMKTLLEVNKIVSEKAINTEKLLQREDQAVQTSYLKDSPEKTTSEDPDSVKTEINVEEESIKTEKPDSLEKESDLTSEIYEKRSSSSKETLPATQPKDLETSDFGNNHTGISFQMLNRMMKDEELRSEHQLALIRLREKTLNEKIKAELTFLEMKKRTLKERGGDEEQNISAIKKKQRGILLKYQSEKEEIERLKKMHKIASEERRIMIKQQKQIQQMQISTNDMIIKLRKRQKSPQKKTPLKALKSSDSQSEIPEDIPHVSDSILTESCSAEESRDSSPIDLDLSSESNISENNSDILRRHTPHRKISQSLESFKSKKSLLELDNYPRKRHSVEELLNWTKRLEEKENHLKELEKQTMNVANKAKSKQMKSLKSVKTSMKDRSTSPFQFSDIIKTISEVSHSEPNETKKSTTISEEIESSPKTEATEKIESIVEKIQSSASEDISEQFSKKISNSRTIEYYSESFESPSSSETPKAKPEVARAKSGDWGHKGITIKLSLSPRMQSPKRRYSSGSDESVNLSHTETASEQSDLETRIAALHEQLRKRKLEAERLRREQKKAQRERLKVKEQSLLKQIQAYDAYIQKKKQELEQEFERSNQTVMKPLIKQPRVAEKSILKRQESMVVNESEKLGVFSRLDARKKETDEAIVKSPEKESDSEIVEQLKDESTAEDSGSITEQVESKQTKSILDVEISESFDPVKSSSVSEILPEQDGSQTESEDQSISIKTTLYSPERQDTEIVETPTRTGEVESSKKEKTDEDVYQFDSFESDGEDKLTPGSVNTEKSGIESSGGATESAVSESIVEEQQSKTDVETGSLSQTKGKSEKAEEIADSIITGLLLESLKVFQKKKSEAERKFVEESKLSLETLSSLLAKEIISEAVDDMIRIYNRKISPAAETPERITREVRRRITEIMSQAGGITREQGRPQDMMVTTYDVSPVTTPPAETASEDGDREKFIQLLTLSAREKKQEQQKFAEGEGSNQESKGETFAQQWADDDFGLSRTRREAEELRLQQLQIEQEIQQLQAQQEQVPYFYLREIPNKPPPPYTPPGKPLTEIGTSESEIMMITVNAVRILSEELSKGRQITSVEPPRDYYGDAVSEHFKCYKFFLFDLAKQIISNLIEQQERKREDLPWMRTRENLSKFKYQKIERTFECLSDFVQKQVLILFGFGRKVSKESLIVRWIKKKRDHVDEILVGESQEEEAQWTRYDEDQITVKNEVTLAILDSLLEDTTNVFSTIFNNKKKREKSK